MLYNIPERPAPKRMGRKSKYNFHELEVGDHKYIAGAKIGGKEYMAAMSYARYHDRNFKCRMAKRGMVVWRFEKELPPRKQTDH